jgi:hypothetical protein
VPGLSPDFVRIDERRYSDWIVFAIEFSKYLRFYDSSTGASLNGWQAFFARDTSAVLGSFAVQNIESYRVAVRERLDFLRDDDHAADDAGLKKSLSEAISAVLTLAKSLDDYYLQLGEDIGLKATLQKFIKAKLAPAFRRLLSYYKAAKTSGLYQTVSDPAWKILNRSLTDAETLVTDPNAFTGDWWDAANGVPDFASVAADGSVFATGSVFVQVSHAANHFLFSSIFDLFTEAYARLIGEAEAALGDTLEKMDSHKPHYALFLTFLRLFRNVQVQLNGITWRHLDYYYKDILRLKPKGAEPNHVHLVAELAKFVSSAVLAAGTLFKAGKDSQGKDVVYALDQETTFNRAEVAEHKAVYRVDSSDTWKDAQLKVSKRAFAAPVMNSADGVGGELLTSLKEWHPFLNKTVAEDGSITSINMPAAEIGFAVASHYLFLAEGTRTIRLRFGDDLFDSFPKERLLCRFTTEKSWFETVPHQIALKTFTGGADPCTEIEIRLAGTDPAVTAFNPKIHGDGFNTDVPVMKCILKNEPGDDPYGLDDLEKISVSRMEVQVQVGASDSTYTSTGAKQVFLANGNGNIDSSKPFQAWGPMPERDSPLIIGSKEMFSKKNASFNLHIEWANRPSTVNPSPTARLQFLEGGVWTTLAAPLFEGHICSASQQRTFISDVNVPEESTIDYRDPYSDYNPASRAGFMRFVLDGNFGQEAYLAALTAFLMAQSAAAAGKVAADKAAADKAVAVKAAAGAAAAEKVVADKMAADKAAADNAAAVAATAAVNAAADAAAASAAAGAAATAKSVAAAAAAAAAAVKAAAVKAAADAADAAKTAAVAALFFPPAIPIAIAAAADAATAAKVAADATTAAAAAAAAADAAAAATAVKAADATTAAAVKAAADKAAADMAAAAKAATDATTAAAAAADKAAAALEQSAAVGIPLVPTPPKQPAKPYLPVISSLYLTYAATSGPIDLTDTDEEAFSKREARLFHVGPFGVAEQDFPIAGSSGHSLVPQFRSAAGTENIGEWYIGIRNLAPRQSVNVLFQFLEGTTIPTLSKPEKHVEWSYWAGNRWIKFEERDIRDSTRQLIQSGIITFVIPHDAATDKGIMPHGFLWLRASVTEKVGAVCNVLSVLAQAMQATFLPKENVPDFLDHALPAGTISKLKEPNAQFKKISQPYPSFGGRHTESSDKFYLRSSERLRHKGRAVTIWDYEHLVLEAFPQLYKVKCLNHTRIEDNPNASLAIHNESQPGYVAVITIPSLVGRNDTNPLKPYTNQALLSEIKDFLKARVTGQLVPGTSAAPQVNVNVCNPLFEEIFIEFALQLRTGYDDFTFYREQLQAEITRFLSPWAFSGKGDVQFGGRIPKSVLINFIEERPYVDFITDVVLKQKPENQPLRENLEEAVATTSRSILVSAVSTGHNITQYKP